MALVAFIKTIQDYGTILSNQLMASVPEINRPVREVDHAPPSKCPGEEWVELCAFMAWTGTTLTFTSRKRSQVGQ